MEEQFTIEVDPLARDNIDSIISYIDLHSGSTYGDSLEMGIIQALVSLMFLPKRFTQIHYLIGRKYVYRRVLVGKKHRFIFTIDDAHKRVDVVRVDLQSINPATLDDLP